MVDVKNEVDVDVVMKKEDDDPLTVFYYAFAAQVLKNGNAVGGWKSFRTNQTWEHARYELELANKLHASKKRTASYLCGYHLHDWLQHRVLNKPLESLVQIEEYELMTVDHRVVIVRKPLPFALQMYVPDKFNVELQEALQKAAEESVPEEVKYKAVLRSEEHTSE